jgi:hypothetical protein
VLYQLSYRRMSKSEGRSPEELPELREDLHYRVSRCAVCLRQRGQNFESSIRSGSFFRFFVVAYVRDRQVEHASVMIGLLSFGIRR